MATKFVQNPNVKPAKLSEQDAKLPAPRISIADAKNHNTDVTIVARPKHRVSEGIFSMECVVSHEEFEVRGIPNDDVVSVMMELTLRPNVFGPGTWGYVNSGMLSDDFNVDKYKEAVALIGQYHTGVFF